MDSESLREELSRLKALFGAPKNEGEQTQYAALVAELERKFLRLKQDEWKRTIDYVAEKRKQKGHPILSDFIAAVAALRHVGSITQPPACEGCSGTGFAFRKYIRSETGDIISGCIPCPGCRRMEYDTWQTKNGLAMMETYGSEPTLVTMAKSLTPKAAGAAYDMIATYRFLATVPENAINALVERASCLPADLPRQASK